MKLTVHMREAFVRAAMDDVPQIDYSQQIDDALAAAAAASMPEKVRALLKDPKCEAWLNREYVLAPGLKRTRCHYAPREGWKATPETHEALLDLQRAMASQKEARDALQAKLEAVARSVTTRKALAEILPEFVKYLPADAAKACRTLPAVANVVADFAKAGWPKEASRG